MQPALGPPLTTRDLIQQELDRYRQGIAKEKTQHALRRMLTAQVERDASREPGELSAWIFHVSLPPTSTQIMKLLQPDESRRVQAIAPKAARMTLRVSPPFSVESSFVDSPSEVISQSHMRKHIDLPIESLTPHPRQAELFTDVSPSQSQQLADSMKKGLKPSKTNIT